MAATDDVARVRALRKVELHQHVDGSIPPEVVWKVMREYGLHPVETLDQMRLRLELQDEEQGTLLAYLDKMHYPLWVTQFYENIKEVTQAIVNAAADVGVGTLELRYSPLIHTYAGLTVRQSIRAVLSGMNHASRRGDMQVGLIVIAMRQHGPHIAKILARQAIGEAQHLHSRAGVIGFDIAGPERGNPPRLFRSAYDIARAGGLGLTAHAGEDSSPDYVWEAIDVLGATRIGHGCAATKDSDLLARMARDCLVVECCVSSNYHTGAVAPGAPHPIVRFLEAGVPVAICCDNTTVSRTDQIRESVRAAGQVGIEAVEAIHQAAGRYSFIKLQ